MSQLRDLYSERAGTFIANARVQQVFGVNDFETAKWLSQMACDLLRKFKHTWEVLRKTEDAISDTMRQLWERG